MRESGVSTRSEYELVLVSDGGAEGRPCEWFECELAPERIRIVRAGVTVGVVAAASGDGCFDSDALGRFQVRYAWIDEEEVASYTPGGFWRGFRERGGLPDTLAPLPRGRRGPLHVRARGGARLAAPLPPPWLARARERQPPRRSSSTWTERSTRCPWDPPPRRPGMRDVAR